jgi:hypothetical protein
LFQSNLPPVIAAPYLRRKRRRPAKVEKIHRDAWLLRYGDYFAMTLSALRSEAVEAKLAREKEDLHSGLPTVSASGLNLHNACHNVCGDERGLEPTLDPPAFGRVQRMGQRYAVRCLYPYPPEDKLRDRILEAPENPVLKPSRTLFVGERQFVRFNVQNRIGCSYGASSRNHLQHV